METSSAAGWRPSTPYSCSLAAASAFVTNPESTQQPISDHHLFISFVRPFMVLPRNRSQRTACFACSLCFCICVAARRWCFAGLWGVAAVIEVAIHWFTGSKLTELTAQWVADLDFDYNRYYIAAFIGSFRASNQPRLGSCTAVAAALRGNLGCFFV